MPGVVAVWTADELDIAPHHGFAKIHDDFARPPLATDRVRFVGEPVAVVFAESPPAGVDAAAAVFVDIEPLPAVVDAEAALGRRRARAVPRRTATTSPSPSRPTPRSTSRRSPTSSSAAATSTSASPWRPMEPHCFAAAPGPDGRLTCGRRTRCRTTSTARSPVCSASTPASMHLITPQVGGGFGGKAGDRSTSTRRSPPPPQRLGRPVVWVPTRTEDMQADAAQPRAGPVRRARMPPRRHVHRAAGAARRRRRRLPEHRGVAAGRHAAHVARHVRLPGDRLRRRRRRHQHRRRWAPIAAPAGPRRRRCSSGSSTRRRTSSASTRSSCATATCSPTTCSRSRRSPATRTTAGATGCRCDTAAEAIGYDELRARAAAPGASAATRSSSGSASPPTSRSPPAAASAEFGKVEVARRRLGHGVLRHVLARPGPPDRLRDDRQRPDRHPGRPDHARRRRHRPRASAAAARVARGRCSSAGRPCTRRPRRWSSSAKQLAADGARGRRRRHRRRHRRAARSASPAFRPRRSRGASSPTHAESSPRRPARRRGGVQRARAPRSRSAPTSRSSRSTPRPAGRGWCATSPSTTAAR